MDRQDIRLGVALETPSLQCTLLESRVLVHVSPRLHLLTESYGEPSAKPQIPSVAAWYRHAIPASHY